MQKPFFNAVFNTIFLIINADLGFSAQIRCAALRRYAE